MSTKGQVHQENKMGVMPENRLILSMAVPMMLSMLVQALYNIVDSIFVAQINENALTAVSLAFPIQSLMIALGTGTGVGINALLSRSLGEKNFKQADKAAMNGIFLGAYSYVVFLVFGIFFTNIFYKSQTNISQIVTYGDEYLRVITIFGFGLFGQLIFERLLQATGKTIYSMITQGIGAVINIILDPLFIFGIGPFPKFGVTGAAVATIIGQMIGCSVAIYYNLKKNNELHFAFKGFRPDGKTIKRIYAVGIPAIIMQAVTSIMTFALNQILMTYTSTATAVLGVYFKLQSFIFMPVFGLNNGMIPIIAYNYGARRPDRIKKTIKLGIGYAVSIMAIGLIIFQCFPTQLLKMFNANQKMLDIGVIALREISISFIFAGFCVIFISVFQALGSGILSLIVSVCRQLLVILPVAYIFGKCFGLDAVWLSFPIAEIVSVTLCVLFMGKIYHEKIKTI